MWIDVFIVAMVLWVPLAFAVSSVRAAIGSGGRVWVLRDRVEVVVGAAECAAVLALGRALGPWDVVPPAVWGLGLGSALFALVLAVLTWSALPMLRSDRRPATRWAYLASEVVIASGLLILAA
jgi:hypothetical protein